MFADSSQNAPQAGQSETEAALSLLHYFPIEQMQVLQDLFAQTHQLALVMTDLEGNWITHPSNFSTLCLILQGSPNVKERCELTYKVIGETVRDSGQQAWQECLNCGFVEAGIPIRAGGVHVANCLVGQNNALKVSRQRLEEYAWLMELDVLQVRNAYPLMPSLPIEQFQKVLNLFSAYASEVLDQAYRAHQLQMEVDRLRQIEHDLRQEGTALVQASVMLRESIHKIGRNLQEVLRAINEITDEEDQFQQNQPSTRMETHIKEMIQKIRRAYRTTLDSMALEQSERAEMETLLYGSRPGRFRHRLARRPVEASERDSEATKTLVNRSE